MPHLKYLNIAYCKVKTKAIKHLLPTEDNALGGCPKLAYLDLWGIENVDVELLKKIILALPKLRFLRHGLLADALGDLTEEEMGEDTARCLNINYKTDISYFIRYDILVKSSIFHRFKNNITTAVIKVSTAEQEQQETLLCADALMLLPKLRRLKLTGVSEAHKRVLPLLESIGDRLVYLRLSGLSGNLSVQDIMRTCPNLDELELHYMCFKNDSLRNGSNTHQNQIESTSKLPVNNCLSKIILGNMNKEVCSSDMLIALLQSYNLQNVLLVNLEAMSDDVMFKVLSSNDCAALSKVVLFSVNVCPLITTAPFVQWIRWENCSLQTLSFHKCEKIDSNILKTTAANCHKALTVAEIL